MDVARRAKLLPSSSGFLDATRSRPTAANGQPLLEVAVADESKPASAQIVCDENAVRIALFVDHASLATLVTTAAEVALTPGPASAMESATARVSIAAGSVVEVDPANGRLIHFTLYGVHGRGWVDPALLGHFFTPAPLARPARLDGEVVTIPAGTPIFDGPQTSTTSRADAFATMGPPPAVETGFELHRSGEPRSGFAPITAAAPNLVLVGWVEEGVVRRPNTIFHEGPGGRMHKADYPRIQAEEGTLLYDPARPRAEVDPIGVIKRSDYVECLSDCGSREPLLWVHTCAGAVAVRALRPEDSPHDP